MKRWIHAATEQTDIYDQVAEPSDKIIFDSENESSNRAAKAIYDADPLGLIQRYGMRLVVAGGQLDDAGKIVLTQSNPLDNFDVYFRFKRANDRLDNVNLFRLSANKPVDPSKVSKKLSTAIRQKLDYLLTKKLLQEAKGR